MGSGTSALRGYDESESGLNGLLRRLGVRLAGLAILAFVAVAVAALATWNVADPSFSHATDNPVTNAMGYAGAIFSDLAMQFLGLASLIALVPAVLWGWSWFVEEASTESRCAARHGPARPSLRRASPAASRHLRPGRCPRALEACSAISLWRCPRV
jgi:hypothetical protein